MPATAPSTSDSSTSTTSTTGRTARVRGSSLLTAIGLPELVTASLDEYEALAPRLAPNPAELAALRDRLARNRLTAPLFDTPRFARNIEGAYKEMWRLYLSGEAPRMIVVVDAP